MAMAENYCRICLTGDKSLLSLQTEVEFRELKLTCLEMYFNLTGLEEDKAETINISQKICISCFAELNNCFKFQRKAIESFNTLVQIYRSKRHEDAQVDGKETSEEKETVLAEETKAICPKDPKLDNDSLNSGYSLVPQRSDTRIEIGEDTVAKRDDSCSIESEELTKENKEQTEDLQLLEQVVEEYEEEFLEIDYTDVQDQTVIEDDLDTKISTTNLLVEYVERDESGTEGEKAVACQEAVCTSDNDFKCVVCSKMLENQSELDSHFVSEHSLLTNSGKYVCSVCSKPFGTKKTLRQHCRVHQDPDSRRFRCRFCDKAFNYGHHLKIHETTHTMEKPFACAFCGKQFASKDRLKNHQLQHDDEFKFACDLCHNTFRSKKALKMHAILKHDAAVNKFEPIKCEKCDKILFSKSAASAHYKGPCGTNAPESTSRETSNKKGYPCQQCDQTFKSRSTLIVHNRVHIEKETPCSSKDCSYVSTNLYNLQVHRTQMHENRFHTCEICGKSFQQAIVLNRHLKTHTGEKPFICSSCPKSFIQLATLKAHEITHSEELQFKCSHCPKKYKFLASLKSHAKLCHNDGES